jgi:hypothetical protein
MDKHKYALTKDLLGWLVMVDGLGGRTFSTKRKAEAFIKEAKKKNYNTYDVMESYFSSFNKHR